MGRSGEGVVVLGEGRKATSSTAVSRYLLYLFARGKHGQLSQLSPSSVRLPRRGQGFPATSSTSSSMSSILSKNGSKRQRCFSVNRSSLSAHTAANK